MGDDVMDEEMGDRPVDPMGDDMAPDDIQPKDDLEDEPEVPVEPAS